MGAEDAWRQQRAAELFGAIPVGGSIDDPPVRPDARARDAAPRLRPGRVAAACAPRLAVAAARRGAAAGAGSRHHLAAGRAVAAAGRGPARSSDRDLRCAASGRGGTQPRACGAAARPASPLAIEPPVTSRHHRALVPAAAETKAPATPEHAHPGSQPVTTPAKPGATVATSRPKPVRDASARPRAAPAPRVDVAGVEDSSVVAAAPAAGAAPAPALLDVLDRRVDAATAMLAGYDDAQAKARAGDGRFRRRLNRCGTMPARATPMPRGLPSSRRCGHVPQPRRTCRFATRRITVAIPSIVENCACAR